MEKTQPNDKFINTSGLTQVDVDGINRAAEIVYPNDLTGRRSKWIRSVILPAALKVMQDDFDKESDERKQA